MRVEILGLANLGQEAGDGKDLVEISSMLGGPKSGLTQTIAVLGKAAAFAASPILRVMDVVVFGLTT